MKIILTNIYLISCIGCASVIENKDVSDNQFKNFSKPKTQPSLSKYHVKAEFDSINSQIAHMDLLISNAQVRKQHIEFSTSPGKEGMASHVEAEISSYKAQKQALVRQRERLENQLLISQ